MECASAVSSTTTTTFSSKESSAIELVTVLGADGDRAVPGGGLDAGHQPRAAEVHVAGTGSTAELRALAARLGGPLDRRVVLAVLLHPDLRQAVQAGDL